MYSCFVIEHVHTHKHNRVHTPKHNQVHTQKHNRVRTHNHNRVHIHKHNRVHTPKHNRVHTQKHNRVRTHKHNRVRTHKHNRVHTHKHNRVHIQKHNRVHTQAQSSTHTEPQLSRYTQAQSSTHTSTMEYTHKNNRAHTHNHNGVHTQAQSSTHIQAQFAGATFTYFRCSCSRSCYKLFKKNEHFMHSEQHQTRPAFTVTQLVELHSGVSDLWRKRFWSKWLFNNHHPSTPPTSSDDHCMVHNAYSCLGLTSIVGLLPLAHYIRCLYSTTLTCLHRQFISIRFCDVTSMWMFLWWVSVCLHLSRQLSRCGVH